MKSFCIALLLFGSIFSYGAEVDTLAIPSPAMGKTYNAAIVLPDSYAKSKANYPVLYLLHGAYGHFRDWLKNTPDPMTVKNLADKHNIIIVMPEGENYSYYLDSPVNKGSQFETYITGEVIPKIDKTYRTVASKKGRAITGLSMGGHGALYLSARHPDLFCAAGSMSGAVDMGTLFAGRQTEEFHKLLEPVFGPQGASQEVYDSHSVIGMVGNIKANGLPLYIDCGVDDFLIEHNRELHRRLLYAKVPHEYTEKPGAHTWQYWQDALPYHMLFFATEFARQGTTVK